jgi:hypothetical protein
MQLRTYLMIRTMEETGCDWMTASEAVASNALAHPEDNLDERKTWDEWYAEEQQGPVDRTRKARS